MAKETVYFRLGYDIRTNEQTRSDCMLSAEKILRSGGTDQNIDWKSAKEVDVSEIDRDDRYWPLGTKPAE